ncbi:MAG: thioredoxin family protein [bacterium]
MMKKIIIFLMAIICACFMVRAVGAQIQSQHPVDVYFFYNVECPHCHEMQLFLANLVKDNNFIKISSYEVSDKNNQALLMEMADAYGSSIEGVPVLFIGEKMFEGNYQTEVGNEINNCLAIGCASPMEKIENNKKTANSSGEGFMNLRWVIIVAALVFIGGIIWSSRKKD